MIMKVKVKIKRRINKCKNKNLMLMAVTSHHQVWYKMLSWRYYKEVLLQRALKKPLMMTYLMKFWTNISVLPKVNQKSQKMICWTPAMKSTKKTKKSIQRLQLWRSRRNLTNFGKSMMWTTQQLWKSQKPINWFKIWREEIEEFQHFDKAK